MLIWGGNCPVSYKNVTNKTKIELRNLTLCFANVREKTKLDIIFQVMKYELKIRWKSQRNKSNENSLTKLNNVLKMLF
jgi:hypothetical protein